MNDNTSANVDWSKIPNSDTTSDKTIYPQNSNHFGVTGWICPVCGKGNSPYNPSCNCRNNFTLTCGEPVWKTNN